jgi:hypothetical protein
VRGVASELTLGLKQCVELETQIEGMEWQTQAAIDLGTIETEEADLQGKFGICKMVKEIIGHIEIKEAQLSRLPDTKALGAIEEILVLDKAIDAKVIVQNNLSKLVELHSALVKKQKRYIVTDSFDLSKTAGISQQCQAISAKCVDVLYLVNAIKAHEQILVGNAQDVLDRNNEYMALEEQLDVCPECGQYIQERL